MISSAIKTGVKIGIATAGVILLFQISSLLLVYHYFKFDYYLTAAGIFFLLCGLYIAKWRNGDKSNSPEFDPLSHLTGKELHILQSITAGKTNKEIAAENFVEVSTIKTHINNMYAKLGVNNRREAVGKYKSGQPDA
jgi:DNA-binding CsgD family transcriptional regulator